MAETKYTLAEIRVRMLSEAVRAVDRQTFMAFEGIVNAAFSDNSEEASREEPGEGKRFGSLAEIKREYFPDLHRADVAAENAKREAEPDELGDALATVEAAALEAREERDEAQQALATHPPTLSDEDRAYLRGIAARIEHDGKRDGDLGVSADKAAAFLRQLADRSTQPEESRENG